jgi:hypothetical protein
MKIRREMEEVLNYMQEKIGSREIITYEDLPERIGTAFNYKDNLQGLVGKEMISLQSGFNVGEVLAIESLGKNTFLRLKAPHMKKPLDRAYIHTWTLPYYDVAEEGSNF